MKHSNNIILLLKLSFTVNLLECVSLCSTSLWCVFLSWLWWGYERIYMRSWALRGAECLVVPLQIRWLQLQARALMRPGNYKTEMQTGRPTSSHGFSLFHWVSFFTANALCNGSYRYLICQYTSQRELNGTTNGDICKTCLTFLCFKVFFAPNKQDLDYNASPHTAERGCHLFTNMSCLIHGSCSCCSETEIQNCKRQKPLVIPPSLPVRAALTTSHLTALISITGTGKRPLGSAVSCSHGFSWEWIITSILTSLFSLSSVLIAKPPQKKRTHTPAQTSVYHIY